jgi:hypothetical protein
MLKSVKTKQKFAVLKANAGFVMYLCIWKRASALNVRRMAMNSPEPFRMTTNGSSGKRQCFSIAKA